MTFGRLIISIVLTSLVFPFMILVPGGSIVWIEGWIFSLWFIAMILSTVIYMFVKDPALLAERRKAIISGTPCTLAIFCSLLAVRSSWAQLSGSHLACLELLPLWPGSSVRKNYYSMNWKAMKSIGKKLNTTPALYLVRVI
jgi:hypothetical protein